MLTLSYEFKLEPTQSQASTIDGGLEVGRKVYNHALAEGKAWVNSRKCSINACSIRGEYIIAADAKRPTDASQGKSLATAKKESSHFTIPQSHLLQQTLKRLETAFVGMWEQGFGLPRFKKVAQLRSFLIPQLNRKVIVGNRIKLPKMGQVKVRRSRSIPDGFKIKQARVIRKAEGYFVILSLQSDVEVPSIPLSGYPIGIDLGLESFIATSENQFIARPPKAS